MKPTLCSWALLGLLALPLSAAGETTIDRATGLVVAKGYETIVANCIACHSTRLIVQNRADRQGWLKMIRWMQETQNMQRFDAATETTMLDYLAKHYAPTEKGRRAPLKVEKWYRLDASASGVK